MPKLPKAKLHPHDARSPRHAAWRKNIAAGMTAAKRKRQAVGLLTLAQVAAETCLPLGAIKKMADTGELKTISAGNRRYVPANEIDRLIVG
jgi:hypothetical protein